jgi:ABC-type branched-subunit amino acid transport system substrate-binding protein
VLHIANDWAEQWTAKHKYTLDLSMSEKGYVDSHMKLFAKWGVHRIAFIWANTSDWSYSVPAFLEAIKENPSLQLVANEKFIPPVRDFRTMLAKVNETRPDILVIWSILPESEIILRQAHELGIKCRFTGYFEDVEEKKIAEGLTFICCNNIVEDFAKRYEGRFHRKAPSLAGVGYDQMSAVIKGCETMNGKIDTSGLLNSIENLAPWKGAEGPVTPCPNKFLLLGLKIVRYHDGQMISDPDFADLNKEMGW